MACLRCLKARRSLSTAVKSAMKGDVMKAISEAMEAGVEIKAKMSDLKSGKQSS